MQKPDQKSERMVDLYWLAFLLTGHSESSVEIAIGTLDFQPFLLHLDERMVSKGGNCQSAKLYS
jgi:hypothetical protein